MGRIRRFEDIQAWQKARELVQGIYEISADGEWGRDFGLKDQVRRAAVSVMSNIAEGFGRQSNRDFARFLDIARGSATEVQSLLYVSLDIGYISQAECDRLYTLTDETIALITKFTTYLRTSPNPKTP